jgi:hypothetical protein
LRAVIPVALSAGTVVGIFLMTVIVLGYVVIWAIWHYFFRRPTGRENERGRAKHDHPRDTSGAPE